MLRSRFLIHASARTRSARRPGFTLLELTVGLAIGGMAVVAAGALLTALSAQAEQIDDAARAVDRSANAERLLRSLVANFDATRDSTVLRGSRSAVSFRTWCMQSSGSYRSCSARLSFRADGEAVTLVSDTVATGGVKHDTGGTVLRSVSSGSFRYLLDAANGGKWTDTWSAISRPLALGVILDQDTLILPLR
jgi:prepilin-type N-terminal cleavage/methylation domain-containing protein